MPEIVRRPAGYIVCVALLLGSVPGGAGGVVIAQELGPAYFKLRAGFNHYGGERGKSYESPLKEFTGGAGPGLGAEIGFDVTARWRTGLFLLSGRFPHLLAPKGAPPTYKRIIRKASSEWISMLGVVGRYNLFRQGSYAPYINLGLTSAFSRINDRVRAGIGPRIGLGADLDVSDHLGVFVEADGVFVYPNRAMDLAVAAARHDIFGFIGFGIRYDLAPAGVAGRRRAIRGPQSGTLRVLDVQVPGRLAVGEPGRFSATVITPDAETNYHWNFGDGTVATEPTVTHRYARRGQYTVTFVAAAGAFIQTRRFTTVVLDSVAPPEILALNTTPLLPHVEDSISFVSYLSGGAPAACRWEFGDGATSVDCTPKHVYAAPGTYVVSMEASNAGGIVRSSRTLTVRANPCADLGALRAVYFDRNESVLTVESRTLLRDNIGQLVNCPALHVRITGYATPDERNPRRLSAERARAVAQYYINLGIPNGRIRAEGGGVFEDARPGYALWQYRQVTSQPVRQE